MNYSINIIQHCLMFLWKFYMVSNTKSNFLYQYFACDVHCDLKHEFSTKKFLTYNIIKKMVYLEWATLILNCGKPMYKILDKYSLIVYPQLSYKTNIISIFYLGFLRVSKVSKTNRFHICLQLYFCSFWCTANLCLNFN